jgi:ribosome maturation factor RimP
MGSLMGQLGSDALVSLEARINSLAEHVAEAMGMQVVLTEIKGGGSRSIVRVYIDTPAGVTLDECERFSKRFSVSLDVEDWIPWSYVLEVSSPGLNRPLRKEADFQRFQGKKAKVHTRTPLDGQKNFRGTILGIAERKLALELEDGRRVEISLSEIEKANLVAEI